MEPDLFADAGEVLRSLLPEPYAGAHVVARRYGLKVWFDGTPPAREHYEAQVIGARHVPGASVLALEVGFHSEHPKGPDNERVLADLTAAEGRWRKQLGAEAVAGPFLGRDGWRRLSETWADVDLGDPDLPVEIGARLLEYITAIEPLRVGGAPAPHALRSRSR